MKANFASASSIWKSQVNKIKRKYPNDQFDLDYEISNLLQKHNVSTYNVNGIETIEVKSEKTVEIPVQDIRSKALLHALTINLKKLSAKYPKLLSEFDTRLTEYFSEELIDVLQVDEIDRLVEIVRYVPQVVKVENVYAYSSSKSRKVEFHLRVLIKALL